MPEIEIRIRRGEASVDLKGFQGGGCDPMMQRIHKELGGKTLEERKKPEYHQGQRDRATAGRGG